MTLSVICRTAAAGPRPAAILASLRSVADEIIVAVDDRADPAARADLEPVADRIVVHAYADPVDRPLPWLFGQCRGDWALAVDDDEIPSLALIEALPALCADDSLVHYSLQVRWLYPDASTYLDEAPWQPHWAARLLRTDTRLIRFSDDVHRAILTSGPGRYVDLPLWHADAILRPFEGRLEKVRRYERARPGLRVAGRALNVAFYLPEARADAVLAPVPDDEREHIEAVLRAAPATGPPRATTETVSPAELDRLWPMSDPGAQDGRLELLERPATLVAGEERAVAVRVHDTGRAAWPWGPDGAPEVRVGSRWYDAAGRELRDCEVHSPFPAPLLPGDAEIVPVHVRSPGTPGAYRLELGLVQQHVRWFGEAVGLEIVVRPQRRVAVVGDDEAVAAVAGILEEIPELELVRLRRSPDSRPGGYPEAPDARAYLFDGAPAGRIGFFATVLWRSLRLRVGPTPSSAGGLVAALRGTELLAVAGLDGPDQRRERWSLRVVERLARSLGVPVARSGDPAELLRRLR